MKEVIDSVVDTILFFFLARIKKMSQGPGLRGWQFRNKEEKEIMWFVP